jgi:cell surface protein SprA
LKNLLKNILRLSLLTLVILVSWNPSPGSGIAGDDHPSGHFINPPDSTDKTDTTLRFPIQQSNNPYDQPKEGGLYLSNPSNIKEDVIYDPKTNEYTLTRKIGNLDYTRPASFSFDEYKNWDLQQAVDRYWQEKVKQGGVGGRQGVIPQLRVGGELFDRVFGGNTIDIRPQGSAELVFGILSNRRDDPAIDTRLRRTTNFDFQERIQMSVLAKIGDKIEFNTNYNTEATFDFENKLKLKYEGKEDEIIQLIEAGNVNLPLNSTLITGSQSLFGLKTQMKFGKATFTTVFSQQQSQTENISVQGGAQTTKFSLRSLEYEENKHFFIGQYFRDHYDEALSTLPVITSNIQITKIEVWITNIGAAVTQNRNIVAFQDLGESKPYNSHITPLTINPYPSNYNNDLVSKLDTAKVRNINTVTEYLSGVKGYVPGIDFEKVESARMLSSTEYTYNSKLGFISLNSALNPDQTLAVAFQYSVIGSDSVYQVGEFSSDGNSTSKNLIVKLLKSTAVNTHIPLWNLMMKNVYNLSAYNINSEDFILNILYAGNSNAVPTGYFTSGPDNIKGVPLIQLLGLDRLDPQLNPPHDGIFDFIINAATSGGTIQATNGRIFFPVLEPFGSFLRSLIDDKALADKLCYDSLYTMTKTGAQQYPEKNKYILEGQYKSSSGSEISLNALNVPQGSVTVTAGGIPLVENVDYTVDYTLGRVKIINEGILNSGTPINISMENNSLFNVYSQTLMGTHLDYKVNNNLLLGGTILNLYERPITQKTNYGDEPISNTIWGGSLNYSKESSLITKLIDKLPFISTKAASKLRIDAEFAQFLPGHSRAVGKTGTSYIDDFEGSKSTIDLRNIGSWFLASTPQGQTTRTMFPEAATGTKLSYGYNRAKLAWYIIDPLFYDNSSNIRPSNVTKDELSKNSVRVVMENELFPNKESATGQPLNISVFNLAYFPEERGPYNYDVDVSPYSSGINEDGTLKNPASRWGGIMRRIETSDFEAANVEYITFWLMDPFADEPNAQGGDLYFNLGDISEDILRDGRKSFEQGLPTSAEKVNVDTTIWGLVPTMQALTNSFASDPAARPYQDVGYDGLSTSDEQQFFSSSFLDKIAAKWGITSQAYIDAQKDPSADNYHYFRGTDFDNDNKYGSILERYKNYNGTEGNSPSDDTNPEKYQTIASTSPNMEDINSDNTLSDQERYFQYVVHLTPSDLVVGENNITDKYEATVDKLENGKSAKVTWYQFKIPIQSPEKVVGSIQDFKSIRFMRMFFRNFTEPVVCRFATFELERGEWRKYDNSLLSPGEYIPDPNQNSTVFDISSVNVEENGKREPVNYAIPPGIEREINVQSTNYQKLNEQAMVLKVCDLMDGDARGAYKTTDFDFREYKRLRMFVHAEKTNIADQLKTGDVTVFVRIGSDFTDNYYEYEVPVEFTAWGTLNSDARGIWPLNNEFNIELDKLVDAKKLRNTAIADGNNSVSVTLPFKVADGGNNITVVGSPSLSDVRAFMVGVRNPKKESVLDNTDDGLEKCVEVWVNELRLTDFNEKSGWAANARISTNLADLGNMVVSGAVSTPGFGSIDQKVSERQKETIKQVDFATNLELGKFLPEKSGIRIPLHYDYSQTVSNPQYNPLDPDVELSEQMNKLDKAGRDSLRNITTEVIQRQNLNLINVRKDRIGGTKKMQLWDIENFDLSYAYSEINTHNADIEKDQKKTYRGGIGYNFTANPKAVRPFQKIIKSKSLKLLSDFNFYYLPKLLSVRSEMYRTYEERLLRNKSDAVIILEPTYTKTWDWNRIYDFKYDLSQSLKFDYNANAQAYIDEPSGGINRHDDSYQAYRDSVKQSILGFGSMSTFSQTANVNYMLPFSKIPMLNWLTGSVRYGVQYRWDASPQSLQERYGNTISNSQNWQWNGNARMTALYNKVPFLKKAADFNQKQGSMKSPVPPSRKGTDDQAKQKEDAKKKPGKKEEGGAEADTTDTKPKKEYFKIIGNGALGVLMSLKDASMTYNTTNGMTLPGFKPEAGPLGNYWKSDAPGLGFIFGSQNDIRQLAVDRGWLSADSTRTDPYLERSTNSMTARANLEPFRNMKIELTADRSYASNYQSYWRANGNGVFKNTSEQIRGNFSSSYIIWPTAFVRDNKANENATFEQMLENRSVIASRLAAANPNYNGAVDSAGFPVGYGATQSEVLLQSFLATYTGRNPSTSKFNAFPAIPLPNWRLTYNLHQGIKILRQYFQSFNITHAYRSAYTVGGFTNDLNYHENADNPGFPSAFDDLGNYIPNKYMEVITLTEQFGPFLGIEMTMKNSLMTRIEYKKTRNLSLSFVNNQLTEVRSNEFVTGVGYRFKNIRFSVRSMNGGPKKQLKSDLNVKLDVSVRDNKTVLRRIEENLNQISTGAMQVSINASADYMVSQKLVIRLFYESTITKPHLESQIPTSTTNAGVSLRFTLTQ